MAVNCGFILNEEIKGSLAGGWATFYVAANFTSFGKIVVPVELFSVIMVNSAIQLDFGQGGCRLGPLQLGISLGNYLNVVLSEI